MTGHGEKLSRKREQAIAALLTQPTIAAAAKMAGIGERTLRRWLKLPEFASAYDAARREVVVAASEEMKTEWLRTRRVHRDIVYRDPAELFTDDWRLMPLDQIPRRALRSILRIKTRKSTMSDGTVVEVEEVVFRPIHPHLCALEEHYSIMPGISDPRLKP
jgi:hypothetical protein